MYAGEPEPRTLARRNPPDPLGWTPGRRRRCRRRHADNRIRAGEVRGRRALAGARTSPQVDKL